jgi:hypothetical protein
MKTHSVCILLTACIKPNGTPEVARPDFIDRENDYVEAFEYYIQLNLPIVFVENSNTVSKRITHLAKGHSSFEYHTFSTVESFKGKGHGEKEILDYAMEHSKLIDESDWIVKISGRYRILNILKLIKEAATNDGEVYINWGRNLGMADTKLMFFKKSFYVQYFKPYLEKYLSEKDRVHFETVFARSVHQFIADGGKHHLWSEYPHYFGINGENGRLIKFSTYKKIKFNLYYKLKRWVYYQMV